MAVKHSISEAKQPEQTNESHSLRKRARLSPSTTDRSDNSDMSSTSVSQASAMRSTPDAVMRSQNSSVSSAPINGTEDDSDSSLESSDDSASSHAGEEEEEADGHQSGSEMDTVITLGAPKKPTINAGAFTGASDLASRLKAFLPQMEQANSELAKKGAGLSMEDVDDEEEHIEMSLGLGVLEQKKEEDLEDLLRRKNAPTGDDDLSESDSSEQSSEDEHDVLDRLMNMKREVARTEQPNIEEVECRTRNEKAPPMRQAPSKERRNDLTLR